MARGAPSLGASVDLPEATSARYTVARADVALRLASEQLSALGARATLLVPAGLATRAPDLLVELVAGGHEIALSVRTPRPLGDVAAQDREAFRRAWHEERSALEAVIGCGVQGFGAAWSAAGPRPCTGVAS